MTIGIGGATAQAMLAELSDMTTDIQRIPLHEYRQRIKKAQALMAQADLAAIYLHAGTNLYYFTGTYWNPSERLVGAILTASGELHYLSPYFEIDTLNGFMLVDGPVHGWHEDQCPYQLCVTVLAQLGIDQGRIGVDESTPFFISDGLQSASDNYQWSAAKPVTAGCRMCKSATELALLQRAKEMTMVVHKAAARILYEGITTQEVKAFIDAAHRKVGARGSFFCIVLFGQDTAFPHGVKSPKALAHNDMVLIDTGCLVEGYNSDITRSYVFGEPSDYQRKMWQTEKNAQATAFAAAQLGQPCGNVDSAARQYLAAQGFGPDYQVPGLPHRTGHGVGLDIHEWPYLVKSDRTPLAVGMCFSNEPMLVLPGEFGIRLEDHFYMTAEGPKWFTEPSYTIDDPFGYQRQDQ